MIKSSKHTTKFSNIGKIKNLTLFIEEYRRVISSYLDHIWKYGYTWFDKENIFHEFNVNLNKLETPSFIDYNFITVETTLTARALSSLVTQLCGILGSSVEKQRKRLFILEQQKNKNIPRIKRKKLIERIKQNIPQKPSIKNINPELSSKCVDFILKTESEFDGFLRLKSIFKDKTEIRIPIRFTKHSNFLKKMGVLKNSFLIKNNSIDLRWELPDTPLKSDGIIVGADQGLKTVLTLSDSQVTPNTDIHGHSLDSILDKLSRKQKGSVKFHKAQDHRKNYINWSINKLNLKGIKQINYEKIWNIAYKNRTTRKLTHWTSTEIRDKVYDLAERSGVRIVEHDSTYRSQRCSDCGLVRKSNRKGKLYECMNCGFILDSDLNAAKNHEIELPEIPWELREAKLNRSGFYWNVGGFSDLAGVELRVPPPIKTK